MRLTTLTALVVLGTFVLAGALPSNVAAATGPYLVTQTWLTNPRYLTAVGDRVFLNAGTGAGDRELWVSEGTDAGTHRVKDIWTGVGSSDPTALTAFGDKIAFQARDGVNGLGVYVSDGTAKGTLRIARRHFCWSDETALGLANGLLYFPSYDLDTGCDLYASDGTVAGTHVVATDIGDLGLPTAFGGRLYFTMVNNTGVGVYKLTDSTASGYKRVMQFRYGSVQSLTVIGRYLYVGADYHLYRSTGTSASLHMIRNAAGKPLEVGQFEHLGKTLLMAAGVDNGANPESDWGLWRSDATQAGTQLLVGLDSDAVGYGPSWLHVVDGHLYFQSWRPDPANPDGDSIDTMWRSDGTVAGTTPYFNDVGFDIVNMGDVIFSIGCVDGSCEGPMLTMTDTAGTPPVNLGDVYNVTQFSLTPTPSRLFFIAEGEGRSNQLFAYQP